MKSTWLGKTLRSESPPVGARANPRGFANVRFIAQSNEEGLIQFFGDPGRRTELEPQQTLRVLALSGGGAGGAFGAGALVGLSRARQRPDFDIVTGVSTGALIAPFALLGPDWDQPLTDAFIGIQASELLSLRGLRPGPDFSQASRSPCWSSDTSISGSSPRWQERTRRDAACSSPPPILIPRPRRSGTSGRSPALAAQKALRCSPTS